MPILDDRSVNRPPYSVVCTFCARLEYSVETGPRCPAFTDGKVPDDIWYGRDKHRKPVDGDHGLTFIPAK